MFIGGTEIDQQMVLKRNADFGKRPRLRLAVNLEVPVVQGSRPEAISNVVL